MEWREFPPLATLRAFAAYAETGSLVSAGAALNVTHVAISQQLRALESHLDLSLFDRSGRALSLTPAGAELAEAVREGFDLMARRIELLTGPQSARPLSVSCTPNFAATWLMPRFFDFARAHPEIDLSLNPSAELVQLEPGGIDLAIRFGAGDWPGLESEVLIRSSLVVVAAPSLVEGQDIQAPGDLVGFDWFGETGFAEAEPWLRENGVPLETFRTRFNLPGNLVLPAVLQGQGVAILVQKFVQPQLDTGELCQLFEIAPDKSYHIVTRPGPQRPATRQFIKWLRRQARDQE